MDGVFVNGSQIELTTGFNWALAYQHYWNPQVEDGDRWWSGLHSVQRHG